MARSTGVSHATVDAADLRVEFCLDGKVAHEDVVDALARIDLSRLTPVSKVPAYRGRRGYSGYWWLASLRRSVPFATLGQADMLISLDYSNKYTQVIHNPFKLSWPVSPGGSRRSVVPPYLALGAGVSPAVVFRGPLPRGLTAESFSDSAGLAARGSTSTQTRVENLRWLAAFRYTSCRPNDRQQEVIRDDVLRTGQFRAAQRASAHVLGASQSQVFTWLSNMLWMRQLGANLDDELLHGKTRLEVLA